MGSNRSPITLNKYVYGNGNSVNNVDPSGNMTIGQVGVAFSVNSALNLGLGFDPKEPLASVGTVLAVSSLETFVGAAALPKMVKLASLAFRGAKGAKTSARIAKLLSASHQVFSNVSKVGPRYPGLALPKYFTLSTNSGVKIFVNPNATKHLAQQLYRVSDDLVINKAGAQEISAALAMKSLQDVLEIATFRGVKLGKQIVGSWELDIVVERAVSEVGDDAAVFVLKHARPLSARF